MAATAREQGVGPHRRVGLLAAGVLLVAAASAVGQQTEARVRAVGSASGTEGSREGNRYLISEPRTVFTAPGDRQVTVAFEWEGRPGEVRFEGRWRDPSGQVVLVSPIDYEIVKPRFDLYWTLGLPDAPAPGLWALEVWVDGRRVGQHAFEVRVLVPERVTAAEAYRKGGDAIASVTALRASGGPVARSVAIALDPDHLLTSYPVIEGAERLRFDLPKGASIESDEIGEWSRQEGWAVVHVPGHGLSDLDRADGIQLSIGSQVFVLGSLEDGSRIIIEPRVVGLRELPTGHEAFRLSEGAAWGSPVLDTSGHLVGVLIGQSDPQLGPMAMYIAPGGLVGMPGLPYGDSALPITALPPVSAGAIATLHDLGAAGHFPRPVSPLSRHVISGVFASGVGKQADVPMPLDQNFVFSRSQGSVTVFLQWNPLEKLDADSTFQIFDVDNKLLGRSEPTRLKLRPDKRLFSVWTFQTGSLVPGVYRVDSLLDGEVAWRGYVQITE